MWLLYVMVALLVLYTVSAPFNCGAKGKGPTYWPIIGCDATRSRPPPRHPPPIAPRSATVEMMSNFGVMQEWILRYNAANGYKKASPPTPLCYPCPSPHPPQAWYVPTMPFGSLKAGGVVLVTPEDRKSGG